MHDRAGSGRTHHLRQLTRALGYRRLAFVAVGLFTGVINVLALTGALYMLQVYDRVIPSRSVATLVGLTVLMLGLYAVYGLLDIIRTKVMERVGLRFDRLLRQSVFSAVLQMPLKTRIAGDGLQPIRDLDAIRGFMTSSGPTAFLDMPWVPLYLLLVFLLHPWLGVLATVGGAVLFSLALVTDLLSRRATAAAFRSVGERARFAEVSRRSAEVIQAMGMERHVTGQWIDRNTQFLRDQASATAIAGTLGVLSKVLRMVLQSAVLGLGAYLVIQGQATGGVMIAASIATARALAPIELAIANWRGFTAARQSLARLREVFRALPDRDHATRLPRPTRSLAVQALTVGAPGSPKAIIHNVSFTLQAGAGLAVVGPSGSGKSTLARALVGAWAPLPQRGTVRLDGAELAQYDPDALGRDIGYLSQDLELIDGTLAENISRFDPEASSETIIAAARLAGVHDLILSMPQGYDTPIGEGGAALSGGQRQRIALARAVYGDPFLIVLDEPNSNLDQQGDEALKSAIAAVRRRGGIVIVIAHRPAVLDSLDQVAVMAGGQLKTFGPISEVLRPPGAASKSALQGQGGVLPTVPPSRGGPPLKVVTD